MFASHVDSPVFVSVETYIDKWQVIRK